MHIRSLAAIGTLCVFFVPTAVRAQTTASARTSVTPTQSRSPAGPATYGTADATSYVIGAYEFLPFTAATEIEGEGNTGDRYPTTASASLFAPVRLPNGAEVFAIEIQGCDISVTGALTATLIGNITTPPSQSETTFGSVSTGTANTPGCDYHVTNITPLTVDNFNRTYYVQLTTDATDSSVRFSAVRLYYALQVSPAPGTATFADVPVGHPFHPFVEALAAAGITGGCGGGNYCPNSPVTRGQMAVFLASALGLHFPF